MGTNPLQVGPSPVFLVFSSWCPRHDRLQVACDIPGSGGGRAPGRWTSPCHRRFLRGWSSSSHVIELSPAPLADSTLRAASDGDPAINTLRDEPTSDPRTCPFSFKEWGLLAGRVPEMHTPRTALWPRGACGMEPGGFEPPCRNGAEAASTCVVTTLISVLGEAGDSPTQDQGIQVSRSAEVCQPIGTSLMSFHWPPYQASGDQRSRKFKPRERTACWQLKVCILFTWPGCSTTRNDNTDPSDRCQSAPDVKERSARSRFAWVIVYR